jgi:hypothetical protein
MKKTFLMLLLAAMSTGAMAEWVRIDGTDKHTTYTDPSAIRRDGNIVKMWMMIDYRVLQVESLGDFRSRKVLFEYDCAGERYRSNALVFYQEQMGIGKTVFSRENVGRWEPVEPASRAENWFKIACGKTKLK